MDQVGCPNRCLAVKMQRRSAEEAVLECAAMYMPRLGGRRDNTDVIPCLQWPARVGGHWASGLPFLDGALKRSSPAAAGFKLELAHVDVADLKVNSIAAK